MGANTRERGGGLELCRQRGDQQQHDGAGAGETVQRADANAWRGVRTWRWAWPPAAAAQVAAHVHHPACAVMVHVLVGGGAVVPPASTSRSRAQRAAGSRCRLPSRHRSRARPGSSDLKKIRGRPITSSVAAWPMPHQTPSRVAARVSPPSAATSDVTATRWSGSEAWRRPSTSAIPSATSKRRAAEQAGRARRRPLQLDETETRSPRSIPSNSVATPHHGGLGNPLRQVAPVDHSSQPRRHSRWYERSHALTRRTRGRNQPAWPHGRKRTRVTQLDVAVSALEQRIDDEGCIDMSRRQRAGRVARAGRRGRAGPVRAPAEPRHRGQRRLRARRRGGRQLRQRRARVQHHRRAPPLPERDQPTTRC